MPCINAPNVSLASIGISLPTIKVPSPVIGLTLCCTVQTPQLPTYFVNAVIALLVSLVPSLGKVLQPLLAILMKAIAIINTALDLITFSCPLNG